MKYLFLLLFLSCGVEVEIPETKQSVTVGPDFQKAAEFCDTRYPESKQDAEDCFLDYRDYFDVSVKLDLDNVIKYCEDVYVDSEDINKCKQDLLDIFKGE